MPTSCPPTPAGASAPPLPDFDAIPEPLRKHYPGARAIRCHRKTGQDFLDRRYHQMSDVVARVMPLAGKAWSLADRYRIGRLVGGLLLGRRRANCDVVGLIASLIGMSRRSLYTHIKVAQVFPDEDANDPLVYFDDDGRRLGWSQLADIAGAAGEPGPARDYWLAVCRRRGLNHAGLRCAIENRDIIDPMKGRAYGFGVDAPSDGHRDASTGPFH